MRNVKITQNQSDAIKNLMEIHPKENILYVHAGEAGDWVGEEACLNSLTEVEMARVLFESEYIEIVPEIEVKDLVINDKGEIARVVKVLDTEVQVTFLGDGENHKFSWDIKCVRHATDTEVEEYKEQMRWRKQGRCVWELKEGDIILSNITGDLLFVKRVEGDRVVFHDNVGYRDMEVVKKHYEVICFVNDRFDIKK